jgi:Ca2+-binding RTX toxin-like protein
MNVSRRGAWLFIAVLMVPFLPGSPASAATGVSIGSVDISIDYFLALGQSPTASDSRSASNFTAFNDSLTNTLSNQSGLASARINASAFIDKEADDSLRGFNVNSNMNGRATKNEDEPTVANPFSSFNITFSPATEVQFFANASSSASNTDSEDCSSVEITLSGPVSFYRQTHAGGGCGTFDPASGVLSGTMPAGEYELTVEADVSMAGEDASASGSAGYGVSLYILPPCDVTGTPGDDPALTGGAGDDVICGLGGDDTIDGGGGNDVIRGGRGDDAIQGGPGLDDIFGEGGSDDIHGGTNTDLVYGGDGADEIFGDDGSETSIANPPDAGLFGGPGWDVIWGGKGVDLVLGEEGPDILLGGVGNDQLDGGADPDHLFGGSDTDKLKGGDEDDRMFGDAGNDELLGGAAGDELHGDAGNDELLGGTADDELRGGTGNDMTAGESGSDDLHGGGGPDVMTGNIGDDKLTGGGDRDDMRGSDGKDVLFAKDGLKDKVAGGPGRDKAKRDGRLDVVSSIEVFI